MKADQSHGRATVDIRAEALYALPVGRHHLVYAPLHRAMALVNTKALDALRGWQEGSSGPALTTGDMGALVGRLETMPCYPAPRTGNLDPAFLGIIPTRACNLSCVYCNFGAQHASESVLDLRQAAAAVDWMAKQAVQGGNPYLDVHFFGGEPFVAGEVIDVVVHRARAMAAKYGRIPRFEAATNGVFDDRRARFVGDYLDTVVLSCDGFQKFHDRQRPMAGSQSSFERVVQTASRLKTSSADLCLRVCVTQENLNQLEPFSRWFGETYRPAIINIETLKPTAEAKSNGLATPDPFEFAAGCVGACRTIEKMGIAAVYVAADISKIKHTFCPVGRDTAILSPDGRISSCYLPESDWQARGLDMNVGHQDISGGIHVDPVATERLRNLVMDKGRCGNCFCRWTCAGGCHVSETYPGCDLDYTDFCIQTRIVTACFIMEQLGLPDKVDDLLENEEAMRRLALNKDDTL